jgi:hypothetical protein
VRRLLTLGHPFSKTDVQAQLQSWRSLALLVALVLCPLAFVLSANETWANEQPSSTEQRQFMGESTTIVNGNHVAEPVPTPVSPPVSPAPSVETPPVETIPPPSSGSAPPEAGAEPAPLQQTVVITTSGGETVGFSAESVPAYWRSDPAPTEFAPTTTPPTTTSELASVSVSADPTAAPTPDLGTPETDSPAVAEEVPAALPAGLSLPSEVAEPVIPGPALQQQVGPGVVSHEQALSGYRSSAITPVSATVRPLTQALNNVIGTSASAASSAVAGALGTVGGWLTEAPSSGEDSPASDGTWPKPFAPVSPDPLGSSFIALFSGNVQASAGSAGATPLLGVLFLASVLLLRRDVRTHLVSCEVPKPSSALLSPLERPG